MFIGMKVDIVASRKIQGRELTQKQFFQAVDYINRQYQDYLASEMIITHGDEAQALFLPEVACKLFDVVEDIYNSLIPHSLRFGFGAGTLATSLQRKAIGMDGVVWHRAEEALQEAKQKKQVLRFLAPFPALSAINALPNLLFSLKKGWTEQQREVIALKDKFATQQELASFLGISPAAVSQRLRAAHYDLYREGKDALGMLLCEELKSLNNGN